MTVCRPPIDQSLMRLFHSTCGALAVAAGYAFGVCAYAQEVPEPAPPRRYAVEPWVSVRETLSDNNNLTNRSDLVNEGTIGLRASANVARLRGYLDYSLSALVYSRGTARDELQNSLAAAGTAELVEGRLFVDAAADTSQQLISAFGARSADTSVANPNRAEVTNYRVSPYLRGRLAGAADYELRLSQSGTHSNHEASSDNNTLGALARLSGVTALTAFTWSLLVSRNDTDYSAGRRTQADQAKAIVNWAATPQLTLLAIGGAESNNYLSQDQQTHGDYGFGIDWRPSERTSLAAQRESRFFGESHAVSFLHRTARTVWSFSDSRDITTTPNQSGTLSIFDLLFVQAAGIEPDPIRRRLFVNAFLQLRGIDPRTPSGATFLTSATTLQRLQNASFAILWPRDTLTFMAYQYRTSRLDGLVIANDDLSSASEIRQRGLRLDLAHRLTPITSVSLGAEYSRVEGSFDSQTTGLSSIEALWTTKLGRRTDFSIGARHSRFTSSTTPYDENAIHALYRMTL